MGNPHAKTRTRRGQTFRKRRGVTVRNKLMTLQHQIRKGKQKGSKQKSSPDAGSRGKEAAGLIRGNLGTGQLKRWRRKEGWDSYINNRIQ